MIWLKTYTAKIQQLLSQDTVESLTYAALECRLALERVCYERLRISHDYIPHRDIRRWPPQHVIKLLVEDANELAATGFTLSMSKKAVEEVGQDLTGADIDGLNYVTIGTQVGFNPELVGKLWQSLSSFLHVKLPRSSDDTLETYGDAGTIRRKIDETLVELKRLEEGTLITSGFGETVHFTCVCGSENRRRVSLVRQDQVLQCINADCLEKYRAEIAADGSMLFERMKIPIQCRNCKEVGYFPEHAMIRLGLDRTAKFLCDMCGAENFVRWSLMQAQGDPAKSQR